MGDNPALQQARRDILFANERGTNLASPFVTVLPVNGASVSVLSEQIGQATLSTTGSTATRLDELQFDLGEGPCWDALSTRRPILEPDVHEPGNTNWPYFLTALRDDAVGQDVNAIFAFPLVIGTLEIGAVDLWATKTGTLTARGQSDAASLAKLVSWQVLKRVTGRFQDNSDTDSISSRREIHQATGMVLAQLDVTAEDAAILLRAHAYATNRTLGEVANDVVERRLDFSADENSREARG